MHALINDPKGTPRLDVYTDDDFLYLKMLDYYNLVVRFDVKIAKDLIKALKKVTKENK